MEKQACYENLIQQAKALFTKEDDLIARMANLSSLLYLQLSHINWAGFYRNVDNTLLIGPFQGKPACSPIAFGKGVCGTCAMTQEIQCVPNVHEFADHIACDADSKSEIVLPIIEKDTLLGVLDIDSDVFNNFDEIDIHYLSELLDIILHHNTYESK